MSKVYICVVLMLSSEKSFSISRALLTLVAIRIETIALAGSVSEPEAADSK